MRADQSLRHLRLAVRWLLRAFLVTGRRGFAASYSWRGGWGRPYPETTGYIIPTLLNARAWLDAPTAQAVTEACVISGDWLVSIQKDSGAFPGTDSHSAPLIFDTGQIIFGLLALYHHTQDRRYLQSACGAADWLISQQSPDGSWVKFTYNQLPHTYHSRVAWAMLLVARVSDIDRYRQSAVRHLDWVVSQQGDDGWFKYVAFDASGIASLHTIAYTVRGLLESALLLKRDDYLKSARRVADICLSLDQANQLRSFYAPGWRLNDRSRCLTGLAQVAIIWRRLDDAQGTYTLAADKLQRYLESQQYRSAWNPNLYGAIAGSHPFWGRYMPLTYPNWAVKFFIDLLLLDQAHQDSQRQIVYPG